MLSLLLITALAMQQPSTSKPVTPATPRGTSPSAVGRAAFHDRMRDLWSDHVVYTRNFIVSATAGSPDTTEVLQRLLRNQDELGEAIKPYYGDVAGTQLASLLRNHIQLAGKALVAAKGTTTAMQPGMTMQDASSQYVSNRVGDTVTARTDTSKIKPNSQNPTAGGRVRIPTDSARASKPAMRVTGDTISQRPVRTDSAQSSNTYAQGQMQMSQTAQVDSASLNQAVTALKANADSIADFLNKANPRGFPLETMRTAIQMHITLLLQEATAQIKKDWSGSVSAFDESLRQANQMADVLSDGIMKQFPSRFSNRATAVSLR